MISLTEINISMHKYPREFRVCPQYAPAQTEQKYVMLFYRNATHRKKVGNLLKFTLQHESSGMREQTNENNRIYEALSNRALLRI